MFKAIVTKTYCQLILESVIFAPFLANRADVKWLSRGYKDVEELARGHMSVICSVVRYSGISDLDPKCVRLVPNGTSPS